MAHESNNADADQIYFEMFGYYPWEVPQNPIEPHPPENE